MGENYEGQLVSLTGEIVETSGSTFYIDDGTGSAKIYVKSSTEIKLPSKQVGDSADVVGILSQWGELDDGSANYRIMPRFQSDLEFNSLTPVAGSGSVLAAESLPVTGRTCSTNSVKTFIDFSAALLLLGLALRRAWTIVQPVRSG